MNKPPARRQSFRAAHREITLAPARALFSVLAAKAAAAAAREIEALLTLQQRDSGQTESSSSSSAAGGSAGARVHATSRRLTRGRPTTQRACLCYIRAQRASERETICRPRKKQKGTDRQTGLYYAEHRITSCRIVDTA